jgi:soluble lytic murein transglycosylase-like protein
MKAAIEKWRATVQRELDRLGAPLPSSQVLAIIWRESNGRVGVKNPKSDASGLMQVMPIALKDYNQNHAQKYTMDQLRATDPASAAIQIRIGTWILNRFMKAAYKYLKSKIGVVPLDELVKVTDTFYAAGPGASRRRLDKIQKPTWSNIKARFPDWDRIGPAELIWTRANADGANWAISDIDGWLEGLVIDDKQKNISGALIGVLLIVVAWFYLKKGGKK